MSIHYCIQSVWDIFLYLNNINMVFILVTSLQQALLLFNLLSSRKWYTEDYWFFYSENWEGEWLILIILQFLWYWTTKDTSSGFVYWTMIIILLYDMNVSYMYFIIIVLTSFQSVITSHFYHYFQGSQIMIQISFYNLNIHWNLSQQNQLGHNTIRTIQI